MTRGNGKRAPSPKAIENPQAPTFTNGIDPKALTIAALNAARGDCTCKACETLRPLGLSLIDTLVARVME